LLKIIYSNFWNDKQVFYTYITELKITYVRQ
jgi:hypothetical protein